MKDGGVGGSNTLTGLRFEETVNFLDVLKSIPGYSVNEISSKSGKNKIGYSIYFNQFLVAKSFKKHSFYHYLIEEHNIDWKRILSYQLLPDDALLVIVRETLFIIEIKFQKVPGSVDEKLQTCDFKRKQYVKLVSQIGLKVEYVYVLSDWFRKPKYKDVLDYVHSVNCHYKFGELPLAWLGLPTGNQ